MFSLRVRSQGWSDHRLHKAKIAIFKLFYYVSYCQEMSLFMDDLLTSNFPVFNASQSELTSLRVAPQIDDHWPWITLYFERNKRQWLASNIENRWK